MDVAQSTDIIQLIQSSLYDKALEKLNGLSQDTDYFGYKGLIAYLQQDYEAAIVNLEKATQLNPSDHRWNELLIKSQLHQYASVDKNPPDNGCHTKEEIEQIITGDQASSYPAPRPYTPSFTISQNINIWIGNVTGRISSLLMEFFTDLVGRIGGNKDNVWTNWYRKPVFLGVLSLAYMRNQLNKHNLFSTFDHTEKEYFKKLFKNKPAYGEYYRTYNGTFNNPDNPIEGAAGTRFQRNVSPEASHAMNDDDILSPNPRWISRILLTRSGEMKRAQHINMIAAAWIQFQNHDWISHPESSSREYHSIDIAEDDPIRSQYHQSKLFVSKTPIDPTITESSPYKHNYINEVTHWWDGSQIYGSDEATCSKLRSHIDGKLKLTPNGQLPTDVKGLEITGYNRNWWVGLSLFHTLFALEHNAICDELKKHYPTWTDEHLFHTARLINAALMAKIHTIEWNSAINPNEAIYKGNHSNWYGFLTTLIKKKKDWHTVSRINIRNTELGGVVGNPIKKFNTDFGLTEEFVEAYRIHSLLPESLEIRDIKSKQFIANIPFASVRYSGSSKYMNKYGIPSLWYSLGNQNPGQVILNNYPRFMQDLAIPGNPVYDMGAVDILRARERGVPRYNEFRRQLGLNAIRSWDDLTTDQDVIKKLKLIYGEDERAIERLDFMIGTLAETHRPTGFAFGETMFQLFLLNATRRLQADRFYTDCYTVQYYTEAGMSWIDHYTLKDVLLRHYPALKDTGLANVTNAFEPWDEDQLLDPMRHPLRAFDRELKKNHGSVIHIEFNLK